MGAALRKPATSADPRRVRVAVDERFTKPCGLYTHNNIDRRVRERRVGAGGRGGVLRALSRGAARAASRCTAWRHAAGLAAVTPRGALTRGWCSVKLRRLIKSGKLAPCYPGLDDPADGAKEECLICFLARGLLKQGVRNVSCRAL